MSKEWSVSIVLTPLCKSSGNVIVYEHMNLGKEIILIFSKSVLHNPNPGVTRKMKYLGTVNKWKSKGKTAQIK